jgi:hypothetical protein
MEQTTLTIYSRHTEACGPPPAVSNESPDVYVGYFENRYGEQWILSGVDPFPWTGFSLGGRPAHAASRNERFQSSSSHSRVAKKLSHIALSKQSPAEPIEGRTPACPQRWPTAIDVSGSLDPSGE